MCFNRDNALQKCVRNSGSLEGSGSVSQEGWKRELNDWSQRSDFYMDNTNVNSNSSTNEAVVFLVVSDWLPGHTPLGSASLVHDPLVCGWRSEGIALECEECEVRMACSHGPVCNALVIARAVSRKCADLLEESMCVGELSRMRGAGWSRSVSLVQHVS